MNKFEIYTRKDPETWVRTARLINAGKFDDADAQMIDVLRSGLKKLAPSESVTRAIIRLETLKRNL